MRRIPSPTAAGRSEGSPLPVGSKVLDFSMLHLTRHFSIVCTPFSPYLRSVSSTFTKKGVQFFVRDSASFDRVAKWRENLVEGGCAIHISLDEFLHITINIAAFGPRALFEKRFNFGFKFQCYCHSKLHESD